MSMIVAHMMKHNTFSSCSGMFAHNERLAESKTNLEIKKDMSYMNYELVNYNHRTYNELIKNKINNLDYGKNGNKKLRKDAVKMCSWIISSDNDFFKNLDEEEERRFFEESLNYFKNEFGEENIISATVHKDETTPHMHLNLIPILDNKFNCKTLFNKNRLKKIQENLPKYLNDRGFFISRGKENSTNKHLNEIDFKIKKRKNELSEILNEIIDKENLLNSLNMEVKEVKETQEHYKNKLKYLENIIEDAEFQEGQEGNRFRKSKKPIIKFHNTISLLYML